jgi:hypothetical protein
MNTYRIDFYAWIPGYNDFDQDEIVIKAESEQEAWKQFQDRVKFCKSAHLTQIN